LRFGGKQANHWQRNQDAPPKRKWRTCQGFRIAFDGSNEQPTGSGAH